MRFDFDPAAHGITDLAVRASSVAAYPFSLGGLNTTNIDKFTPGSCVGSVVPVSTWVQIYNVTGFTVSGGEQQFLTVG